MRAAFKPKKDTNKSTPLVSASAQAKKIYPHAPMVNMGTRAGRSWQKRKKNMSDPAQWVSSTRVTV